MHAFKYKTREWAPSYLAQPFIHNLKLRPRELLNVKISTQKQKIPGLELEIWHQIIFSAYLITNIPGWGAHTDMALIQRSAYCWYCLFV